DPSNPQAIQGLAGAEQQLSGSLGKMFALAESYPDLKASANMVSLQEELTSTENKVAFSRQGYNDGVMLYNTYRQTFPPIIFASMFGHPADAPLLEFDSEAIAEAPQIKF
ncbi:MAG: LemA family protein, partial [Planctomycetaceae bacterium]|nr:LemA family protein [Planctomycetaceae bacterium]